MRIYIHTLSRRISCGSLSLLVVFLALALHSCKAPTECDIPRQKERLTSRAWKVLGNLREGRNYFEAQPISSSEGLVMGGYANGTHPLNGTPSRSCEIIDADQKTITLAEAMNVAHAETVSLLTADSNVVILSGMSDNGVLTPSCEIFDRRTRSWRVVGTLLLARRQHTALFINTDEILVVGGRDGSVTITASAEIFNIRTGRSRRVADFPVAFCIGTCGVAENGDVLVMGGNGQGFGSVRSRSVCRFNRTSETWETVSTLPESLAATSAVKMSDGRLGIFYGQTDDDENIGWMASSTVYTERQSAFSATTTSPTKRYWATVSEWNQDSLLIVGGFESGSLTPRALNTAEWFDVRQQRIFPAPDMLTPRAYAHSLSLPRSTGGKLTPRVLAISGFSSWTGSTTSVEVLE